MNSMEPPGSAEMSQIATRREGRWEEARDPSPPFWWGPGEAVAAMGWDAQGPQWQRQTKIWRETLTFTLPWGQKPGVLTNSISIFSRIFQLFFQTEVFCGNAKLRTAARFSVHCFLVTDKVHKIGTLFSVVQEGTGEARSLEGALSLR